MRATVRDSIDRPSSPIETLSLRHAASDTAAFRLENRCACGARVNATAFDFDQPR
jgi:hypothetical protein